MKETILVVVVSGILLSIVLWIISLAKSSQANVRSKAPQHSDPESKDETDQIMTVLRNSLNNFDYRLTHEGIGEAVASFISGYTATEVFSYMYVHRLAWCAKNEEIDAFLPDQLEEAYSILEQLKNALENGTMRHECWKSDTMAIGAFIFNMPYTEAHFELADKILANTCQGTDRPLIRFTGSHSMRMD